LARSFFGPVVRPARGGVSGSASASRPKAAPQETQDMAGNAGQAWQTCGTGRHGTGIVPAYVALRSPDGAAHAPFAGRSRMPSWHPLTRCRPRFAILASLVVTRRLSGHGQPLHHCPAPRRSLAQHSAVWRTAAARSGNPRRCPRRSKRKRAGCSCFACTRQTGRMPVFRGGSAPNIPRSGGPRPPVRATLGVARDGPSENGQDARVSRVVSS